MKVFYVQIHTGIWLHQAHIQAKNKKEVETQIKIFWPGEERVNIYEVSQKEAEKYFPTEQQA